jgi:hypothetical protein
MQGRRTRLLNRAAKPPVSSINVLGKTGVLEGRMIRRAACMTIFLLGFTSALLKGDVGGTLVVTVDDLSTDTEAFRSVGLLPGATVRISTDSAMNAGRYGSREAITDSKGHAVLYGLPPDEYWLEVSLQGFETRKWLVDIHSHITRRVSVGIGVELIRCTLFDFWDLRGLLDPGFPATTNLFSLARSPDRP